MKKTLKIMILLFLAKEGSAQTVINSTGGQTTINGQTHEYSIGEVVMHTGPSLVVTQGVLQPKKVTPTTGHISAIISDQQLQIFPIPTQDILNLQGNFSSKGTLQINIMDISGKLLISKDFQLSSGKELNQLNMKTQQYLITWVK